MDFGDAVTEAMNYMALLSRKSVTYISKKYNKAASISREKYPLQIDEANGSVAPAGDMMAQFRSGCLIRARLNA